MATIDNLNKSISAMPDEEVLEHLRKLRASRRTPKNVGTKSRSRPEKKLSTISLSIGQREDLVRELEEMMR